MNLKQLSHQLGLSQTTVSRALNNYPEVNAATRERVKQAAKEFNYRPNARATGLATGRAGAIGHVIPVNSSEVLNPIFTEFIAGASQTYSTQGYELILSLAPEGSEDAVYRQLAARKSVDGIIVHGPRVNDHRIPLLQGLGLPFVLHGRDTTNSTEYAWIDINNRRAFFQATKLLADLGHKRIALINGDVAQTFTARRRSGYLDALQQTGLRADESLMFHSDLTEANGYQAASELLASEDPPTAFLVSSYMSALGVRHAIHNARLSLGPDVSVIIHDDDLSYGHNSGDIPQFTATRSSVKDAGILAAEMLLSIIDNPDAPLPTKLLEANLIIGASTGPRKQH